MLRKGHLRGIFRIFFFPDKTWILRAKDGGSGKKHFCTLVCTLEQKCETGSQMEAKKPEILSFSRLNAVQFTICGVAKKGIRSCPKVIY